MQLNKNKNMINKIKNYLKLQKQLWFRKMFQRKTLILQSRYSFHNINEPIVKTFIIPIDKLTPKEANDAINDLTGKIYLNGIKNLPIEKDVWLPSPQDNTMFICDEQLEKKIKQKYAQTKVNPDYYQEIKITKPDSDKIVMSSVYGEFDKSFQISIDPNE